MLKRLFMYSSESGVMIKSLPFHRWEDDRYRRSFGQNPTEEDHHSGVHTESPVDTGEVLYCVYLTGKTN